MNPARDPFYIVKGEIQESLEKLQVTFLWWERNRAKSGEHAHLVKELLTSCESIDWQLDELDKAVAVAGREPARYGLDEVELQKRKRWTATAHAQVSAVRSSVEAGREKSNLTNSGHNGMHHELMRHSNGSAPQRGKLNRHIAEDGDDFISSESDQQLLLIKQQDEELDELSASVQRIGGVGLTIHEELVGQEKILDELSMEMETTSNRLDFVQNKVAMVMKKASVKGQIMMIAFLVVLFIVLFVLVFLA